MKATRILLVALPSVAAIVILIAAFWPQPSYIPRPRELNPETSITVWRLVSCGVFECGELENATSVINKYPQLQSSMREMDQRFESTKYDEKCRNNECIKSIFFNQTVSFLMPTELALQLSGDLENAGAKRAGQCIEGGCHSLVYKLNNSSATYEIALYYGGGFDS